MIRIVKNNEKLVEADLIGKWVLVDLGYHWAAFGRPRIATALVGSRLSIDESRAVLDPKNRLVPWSFVDDGKREPDGTMLVKKVHCICDTAAEVNHVLSLEKISAAAFKDIKQQAIERLTALDGTTV